MRILSTALVTGTALVLVSAWPVAGQVNPDTLPVPVLVEAAREAARGDRNAEAAALFRAAIEKDPSIRGELLAEYADQLTYSDQARAAVPLYREILAADPPPDPETSLRIRRQLALALSWSNQLDGALQEYEGILAEDPQDRDALVGRARVLSWQGRLGPAWREYERAVSSRPGDMEARRDLARVQVWRGRHREGVARLEDFLGDHPDDREARLLLAQTFFWMGRPDRAAALAAALDVETPPGSEFRNRLEAFLFDLEKAGSDLTRGQGRISTQSDHLTIRGVRGDQVFRVRDGRDEGSVHYQGLTYEPRTGPGEASRTIREHRVGVQGRIRPSDGLQLSANLQADLIRAPSGSKDRDLVTYDAYATLWPSDDYRIDVGSRRETLDNERSLLEGITATYLSASVDWVPDEKSRVTLRGDRGHFTDGNNRLRGEVEFARRVLDRPHVILGGRAAWFSFDELLYNGYFNPKWYRGSVVWSHGWGQLGQGIWWDYDLSYGWEALSPGEGKPIWSAGGSLTRGITRAWEMKGAYEFFSSRHFSSSGFERGTFLFSLEYRW